MWSWAKAIPERALTRSWRRSGSGCWKPGTTKRPPHQAALTYALQTERLPDIAGRYRALLDDPEEGARAKKKIDGIVVAATQLSS